MATPKAIVDILNWQAAHQGQVPYSETASTRLASDDAHMLSTTDCSGMAARMFAHFAGLNIGTYTGNECFYGELITTSKSAAAAGIGMLPGDCILFDWDGGNWDHIAIYAGNGRIWNHGGPGYGPLNWSLASNVDEAVKIMVRRFLSWDADSNQQEGIHMEMGKDELVALMRQTAQEVVTNYDKARRGGESTGHWEGDGADAGTNDRLTRVEHRLGMDKHGDPLPSPPKPNRQHGKGN